MIKLLILAILLCSCTNIEVPKNPSVKIPMNKATNIKILHTHNEEEINNLTGNKLIEIIEIVQPNDFCYKVYYRIREVE